MIVCQFRTFSYVGNDSGFEENGAELKYLVAIRWFVFMLLTQNKYLLIIVWILMASLGTIENCRTLWFLGYQFLCGKDSDFFIASKWLWIW